MTEPAHFTRLGKTGPAVFPIGLGCMGMSGIYGASDDAESVATIRAAIERGVTLLDTGDFYRMGHNELLVRRGIEGLREKMQVSVKFGALRGPDGSWLGVDARPAAVKTFAAYSLKRLGIEVIDIYRPARLDPSVPIEETVGAIGDLVKAGYVRHIGLSEVGVETIRRACAVQPIVDLQIEYAVVTVSDVAAVEAIVPKDAIAGTRYAAEQMKHLDSERWIRARGSSHSDACQGGPPRGCRVMDRRASGDSIRAKTPDFSDMTLP